MFFALGISDAALVVYVMFMAYDAFVEWLCFRRSDFVGEETLSLQTTCITFGATLFA